MALIPLYFQTEKKLREKILKNEIAERDGTLPSEEQLCKQFGVSRITMRKALGELVLDGLIIRKAGRGTFVLPKRRRSFSVHLIGNFDELVTCGVHSRMKLLRQEVIDASPEIREKLDLGQGEKVYFYEGVRQLGKESYSFFNVYVPIQIGKFLTPFDPRGKNTIFNLIEERTAFNIMEADQIITACIVNRKIAKHLGLQVGEAILSAERLYFSQERKPVELAITYYRPDLYQYKAKLIRRYSLK